MLELVNRDRATPNAAASRLGITLNQGLASGSISPTAKQPLAFNFLLIDAARGHSQWMLNNDVFSHSGVGGSNWQQRMASAGYSFVGNWESGENLAFSGINNLQSVTTALASQHNGLFTSTVHRPNLLSNDFREIGIAAITGEFEGSNALITTQDFARTGTAAFLTGVAYDDGITNDDFYTVGEGLSGITVTATPTDNSQPFSTTTYGSGGYQLALTPGTYEISFSGGALSNTYQRYITITDRNVKLDLVTDLPTALQPLRIQGQTPSRNNVFIAWDTETSVVSSFNIDATNLTASTTSIGRIIEDTNWKLQTIGDLNGDGQDDVLLRHFAAGQNLLWQMTPFGEAIAAERVIGRNVADPNWSLSGTGDFNGDGQIDIILRNETADQIVAWYMNLDGTIQSESLVGRGFGDNNWKIEATADFNNDGQTDILLNNALSGQTLLWTMTGSNITSEALVGRTITDQDWKIEGAKDFNNDGITDLFWRHSSGQGLLWTMQSPTQIGQEQIIANVPDGKSQLVL